MSRRRSSPRLRRQVERLTYDSLGGRRDQTGRISSGERDFRSEVFGNGNGKSGAHVNKRKETESAAEEKGSSNLSSYISSVRTLAIFLIIVITAISIKWLHTMERSSLWLVWSYGWITAAATGLGALPFFFFQKISGIWLGVSNTIAAGMMIAASVVLILEGVHLDSFAERRDEGAFEMHGMCYTALGFVIGNVFMRRAKYFLDAHEGSSLYNVDAYFSRRTMLIVFVMTVHSFSEGVAIGVAFAGEGGTKLGSLTATSLAIHNIPEGLAISLALVPKGSSVISAAIWSVASSAPQPMMAVVAYAFVDKCTFLVPVGLGFAAGAMLWVSFTELLREALQEIPAPVAFVTTFVSSCFMAVLQTSFGD